jgi:uncharacterized membrane protein
MNSTYRIKLWHRVTQLSFGLLIGLLIGWHALWFPPERHSAWLLTGIIVLPLMFPLLGVIKGKLYTYAWLQFINMIYFCHAVVILMSSTAEFWLGLSELLLVLINFTAAIICIRLSKKHASMQ